MGPESPGAPPAGAVVRVFDETSGPAGDHDRIETERWAGLAAAVLREEGVAEGELGLRFVDPGAMAELNVAHMGVPGPTDVLAFPIDGRNGRAPPCEPAVLLGDVVVCPAYAARDADCASTASSGHPQPHASGGTAQPGHPQTHSSGGIADELALLVVHGVLHVLGYDHAVSHEAAAMQARERQLLAAHHRAP